jgi:hypothetical protein
MSYHPAIVATACLLAAQAFAQGSLIPSSGPAPTMKTLAQIEARKPLGSVGGTTSPLNIDRPGSYVLMGNVTVTGHQDGISISAEDITLDLNGFTISASGTAGGSGILIWNGGRSIAIRNGHIVGFMHGIHSTLPTTNISVADITVAEVRGDGIGLGVRGATVDRCAVAVCGGTGITAERVANSNATRCTGAGIVAVSVESSIGEGATAPGIDAAGTVTDCTGTSDSGHGIRAQVALNCLGSSATKDGIHAETAANSLGSTAGDANAFGLSCGGTASFSVGTHASAGGVAILAKLAIGCTAPATNSIVATTHLD